MEPVLKIIGRVNSELKNKEECPLQENENAPEAVVTVFPEFMEAAADIKEGQYVLLLTWLHLGDRAVLKCKPRNNEDAALTGVFSTRSPDRPNPIGLHAVKVVSVAGDGTIKVSGLEAVNDTPVIDIKPVKKQEF
jgi:tRNA-Thr(GGU) m(6)t(6)A37 methyltransferase TsaA